MLLLNLDINCTVRTVRIKGQIMLELGAETARKRLPELLDRAQAGEPAIIKKRGIPYAALVPLDQQRKTDTEGLLALRGSGAGLWGPVITDTISDYRNEW